MSIYGLTSEPGTSTAQAYSCSPIPRSMSYWKGRSGIEIHGPRLVYTETHLYYETFFRHIVLKDSHHFTFIITIYKALMSSLESSKSVHGSGKPQKASVLRPKLPGNHLEGILVKEPRRKRVWKACERCKIKKIKVRNKLCLSC